MAASKAPRKKRAKKIEVLAAPLVEILRILEDNRIIDPFARKQAREKLREFFERFGQ